MSNYYRKLYKLEKYLSNNYDTIGKIMIRGKGIYVFDKYDNKYIDCISGYSALNQGHCHPNIIKAAEKQMKKLTLTSRAYHNNVMPEYSEKLCKTFNYDKVLLMNGGVESGESAIKIARAWGYKYKNIPENSAINVFFNNNFWGRSLAACSSSNDPSCYNNFGPYVPNFKLLDYNNINQLHEFLEKNANVVSIMLEPIQGEGGIIIPHDNYLKNVKELCNYYNVLMIADEVQTGLGRTGKMLACEHQDVKPDILCLGKALSGGFYPISAVLSNQKIMSVLTPGTHGSTFGGNPLASAIGIEALNIIQKNRLPENAEKMGEIFRTTIKNFNNVFIKDVRGKGLLNGIEFYTKEHADLFVFRLLKENVLTKTTRETVVRITPPLVITSYEMDILLSKIDKALYSISLHTFNLIP
jgi:ornithine--oxo-acid transaminase